MIRTKFVYPSYIKNYSVSFFCTVTLILCVLLLYPKEAIVYSVTPPPFLNQFVPNRHLSDDG